MRSRATTCIASFVVLGCLALATSTRGAFVVEYIVDPTTGAIAPNTYDARPDVAGQQVWDHANGVPFGAVEPLRPDVIEGEQALHFVPITDEILVETVEGDSGTINGANTSDALANGFQISTRVWLPPEPNINPRGSFIGASIRGAMIEFATNGPVYRLSFGTDIEGDPIVDLSMNVRNFSTAIHSYTVTGGAGKFNDYALRYEPSSNTVDVLVNNSPIITGIEISATTPDMHGFHVGDCCGGVPNAEWAITYVRLESPVPPPLGIPGDANGDEVVDLFDYEIIRDNMGTGVLVSEGNIDRRGKTSLEDFLLWRNIFESEPPASPVPEPATGTLLGIALAGLLGQPVVRLVRRR